MTDRQLTCTIELVVKDLSLEQNIIPESTNSFDDLKAKLIPVINSLLNTDFNRLLNSLYRIDIDENKLKSTLAMVKPELLAESITDLILNREMEKAATRIKYSS